MTKGKNRRKAKRFIKKNSVKVTTIFIVLLTVFSAFAVVAGNLNFNKGKNTTAEYEYIGRWGEQDFYKKEYKNYFTVIKGQEWHFRGNPMIARSVNVTPEEDDILRAIKGVKRTVLLIDPKSDEKVLAASTDLARFMALISMPTTYAFTEKSESEPQIPVMSAWDSNDDTLVIEFRAPSNETRVSSQFPIRPHTIIIEGSDFDSLDAAVARVTLIALGVRE